MKNSLFRALIALALLVLIQTAARADMIYTVSVNTSNLSSDPKLTGPFGIDFQLFQGDGTVVNSATISHIDLGGGSAVGSPSYIFQGTNNVSGDLLSGISLNDNGSFYNEFEQQFTPGKTLSFQVDLSGNVGTFASDGFSFALMEKYDTDNVEIPTIDPTGTNTLLSASIDSSFNTNMPNVATYGGTNPSYPITTDASPMPEPGTLVLSLLAMGSLAAAHGWRRIRAVLE